MTLTLIDPKSAFPLSAEEIASFDGPYAPYQINGPPGLARLVACNSNPRVKDPRQEKHQNCWFDEALFTRVRAQAKAELTRQGGRGAFTNPWRGLVGMFMKHIFRDDLAICNDWREVFDCYAILPLRPMDGLVVWAGTIRWQPAYSPPKTGDPRYAEKKAAHDLAEKNRVRLAGGQMQFIVNFDHEVNLAYRGRIEGPHRF